MEEVEELYTVLDELADALVAPTTVYYDAKFKYEALRSRLIDQLGYDGFRDLQQEAFNRIWEAE